MAAKECSCTDACYTVRNKNFCNILAVDECIFCNIRDPVRNNKLGYKLSVEVELFRIAKGVGSENIVSIVRVIPASRPSVVYDVIAFRTNTVFTIPDRWDPTTVEVAVKVYLTPCGEVGYINGFDTFTTVKSMFANIIYTASDRYVFKAITVSECIFAYCGYTIGDYYALECCTIVEGIFTYCCYSVRDCEICFVLFDSITN